MVFESIVADLLNKYLGKYVENLDASQLKIGIWGGNVVLESLRLKDTALDDLDLPIKVVKGFLGKLTLAIPWKNLYQESTVVNIEDLHILAKPNFDIKYNASKEEKSKQEKKRQQIESIEEARRLEEEKRLAKKEKKAEEQDSFTEKLATNVIKNLQITIQSIHIRYEDSVSDSSSPFAVGITLENLSAQTTDENFVPKIIKESVTIIHKLVRLDNLALYWNPKETFQNRNTEEWLEFSRNLISKASFKPSKKMHYLLKPLIASKTLKLNTKAGMDMNIPKIFLNVALEELGIILLRSQYHGLVQLLESFDRMNRNVPFRKYRPTVQLKGNPRIWWKYCMTSILEEDVKRKQKMWSWKVIKQHRVSCHLYKRKYREKLLLKNPSKALLESLEKLENELNVTSITIFRQLAENEASRERKQKKEASSSGGGGFFSGWFSSSKVKEKEKTTTAKIEELMGLEKEAEMKKLYEAIGYSENEVITAFPAEYVATIFQLTLKRISITIRDDTVVRPLDVLQFVLDDISLSLSQRPSASALKAHVEIEAMKLFGTSSVFDDSPLLVRNITKGADEEGLPLVNLTFESNPLKSPNLDQCVQAVFQPLEIIYDANSVNKAIAFFEPPKDVILQDLQEKAYSTFEEFRESSTAGLLYAMEQRTIMELDVKINSSYLIVPEKGSMINCTNMVVVNFGSFHLKSDPCQIRILNPKDIDDIEEVQKNAYDKFLLHMSDVQIFMCRQEEDIQTALSEDDSKMHILLPIAFDGKISKALVASDPRLKQMVICGNLSSVEVHVSNDKISRAYKIFNTLPLPEFGSTETDGIESTPVRRISKDISYTEIPQSLLFASSSLNIPSSDISTESDETIFGTPPEAESILNIDSTDGPQFESGIANQVKVEFDFSVRKLHLSIGLTDKEDEEDQKERECLEVSIDNINGLVIMRRWDMFVEASVGRFILAEMTWGDPGEPLYLFSTPEDQNMLQFSYRKCEFDQMMCLGKSYLYSAEAQIRALHYKNEYGSIKQIIDLKIAMLNVILHQEALLSVMTLIQKVLEPLNKAEEKTVSLKKGLTSMGSHVGMSMTSLAKENVISKKKNSKSEIAIKDLKDKVGMDEEVELSVTAKMAGVSLIIKSDTVDLAQTYLTDLSSMIQMRQSQTEIKADLKNLQILDDFKRTSYREIVSMSSDQVFDLELIMFNEATTGKQKLDMSQVDMAIKTNIGQMKIVFLNRFITDILLFINNFEEAKNAIYMAGKSAKDAAAAAMTEYSHHASRNLLNVVIRAPTIIVPVNSLAELALHIDLGELRVFNNFKLIDREKGEQGAVVSDNMTIRLTELKLLKCLIKNGRDIIAQRAIIKPMSMSLNVIRNLTPNIHTIPDMSVEGCLKTIALSISEEDVTVAFKVLYGNLAEGYDKAPVNGKHQKTLGNLGELPDITEDPPDRLGSIYEDEEEEKSSENHITLAFHFELEKVLIKLYLKPYDMTFEEEFLERVTELLLSQFIIGHFDVRGKMYFDQSMNVDLFLETLILDDLRPTSQKTLTRMVDFCPEPLVEISDKFTKRATKKNMIEIEYSQSAHYDRNIELSLNNLLTILNLEFLMTILRTLQSAMPTEDEKDTESMLSDSPSHSITSSEDEIDTSIGELNDTLLSENSTPPETRVQIYIQNPQIVFLADAKDIKTNALFLTTEVNFQYLELNNVQKMMGTVVNTSIVSTAFKNDHRTDITQVLSLDNVNLHSSAPLGGNHHVDINTTVIKIDISPKTIRTLSACFAQTAEVKEKSDIREGEKLMKQLWQIVDITNKHLWYLQTPPPSVLSAGSFVLARAKDGYYQNGFLSKSDTHFLVFFYPEGSISHSVNDLTSVIVDMVPKEEQCLVGENVLAIQSGETRFRTGRIMEIWRGNNYPEHGYDVSNEPPSEDDWEAMRKDDDTSNKYLVRYYHDNSEQYFLREEMRLLPRPIKNVIPGLGSCVYARYNDAFYYRGFVEKLLEFKMRIGFDEINEEIDHDRDDPSAVILNLTPQEHQIKRFFKVIAQKGEGSKGYHPGKVIAIQGNAGQRSYSVRFEDGSMNQVPITKLLLMPKAPHDALPEVGTYVYSRVARDSPLYEKAIVADKDKERIYVKHLNGRKLAHERQNISFVLRNIVPLMAFLKIGQDVIAQVDNDDLKMYMGTIKEVVQGSKSKKYVVQFTDGSIKKLTPGKIRIISTFGSARDLQTNESKTNTSRKEQMILEVEGICFSVQQYIGGLLTPVLRFNMKVHGEVTDWSSLLNAYATVSLVGNYYNEMVAEWEPLIEQLITNNREKPWQLTINYITEDDKISSEEYRTEELALLQKPMTSLLIQSTENMEITITKESLALLQNLGEVFGKAVESSDVVQNIVYEKHPYIIFNMIGKDVSVTTDENLQSKDGKKEFVIKNTHSMTMKYEIEPRNTSFFHMPSIEKLPVISIKVDGYRKINNIIVKRQRLVIYDLLPDDVINSKGLYSIVIDVKASDGQRQITLRTPLQIENHFPVPLDISYINKEGVMGKLTTIETETQYSIPLIPTYHSTFRIKPAGFGYLESTDIIDWKELTENSEKQLFCPHPDNNAEPFLVKIVSKVVEYTSIHGMIENVPRFTIHCYPPIVLHNYLPYPISYKTKGMALYQELEGGSNWPLYSIDFVNKPLLDIKLDNYLGLSWAGSIAISGCKEDETTRISTFYLVSQTQNKQFEFSVYSNLDGSLHVTLFASHWLLNKTGKSLVYQLDGSNVTHEHLYNEEGALMFNVKGKKKKARLSVLGCSWSDEFPIDTIGSGGSLKSEGIRSRVFEIGVGITVSYFGLTKIVTFTPLRNLTNHTKETISMAEYDSDTAEWHTVKPGESVPYWPTCLPPKNLYLNINGIASTKFNLEPGKTLLLKFRNEIGGICVNYQEKDSSSLLSFSPYFDGAAPVRIENTCKKISMISYQQSEYSTGYVLTYGQSLLYTWDDPTKPHELICAVIECTESQKKIKLDTNDFGRMKTADNAIYWVSFLDGLQRVLLFTDDFKTAYCASEEQTLRPTQEISVKMEGFGLSLVNAEKRMEIGYLGIRKSKVVWEKFTKRWKTLTGRLCDALEEGYNKYIGNRGPAKEKVLDMEVDYEKMFITKPERMKIRRTFHSGFEFQYIISPNRMQIRAAVSSIQLDSHVPGSTFRTVVSEIEPPKSVTIDNVLKPFFEMSLTTNIGDQNIVSEVSYLKVLIQETDIKVDKGFLLSVIDLFANDKLRGNERSRYDYDMTLVKQKLEESPEFQAAQQDKRYVFDYFHLSPLKIHVSFSMTGGHAMESESSDSSGVLGLLFQSVGVAFTEIQDVEFKLACFEVESLLMSYSQLTNVIQKHYQHQAINQLYVLVLGLDVLGNPYGLITGVGAGAKNFFYEPYQGLIQGPEEFAEGLAYGVKSLVGGTVGGVSGAVSKITGTVGKGLAALTLDDEFQQKRRQQMSQRPTNVAQGLLKGGKGLAKGVVSGVTGIVVKPYEGAKNDGVGGFFKGIGKGLIGVVARPAGGVVDMASSTFEGIKNTTVGVNEAGPLRIPRVFHADKVLRPFNEYEATGNKILMEVEKGLYSKSDFYMIHVQPINDKNVLILTNRNILCVHLGEILNEWECIWRIGLNDLKGDPIQEKHKVTFNMHSTDSRKTIFKKNITFRVANFQTEAIAKWFLGKLEKAKML